MMGSAQLVGSQQSLEFDISPEKLMGITDALDEGGIGSFVVKNVLNQDQLDWVMQEVNDPAKVVWRDNHNDINNRRKTVLQRHDTFAIKVGLGDQSVLERIPKLHELGLGVQGLVRDLAFLYPSLENWIIDEITLNRYDEQEVGLSHHFDYSVNYGLVTVLSLDGVSDVSVLGQDGSEEIIVVEPGDLSLTRGTGLYEHYDEHGDPVDIRPEHAVFSLKTPTRTSLIVRANSDPERPLQGVSFDNWP